MTTKIEAFREAHGIRPVDLAAASGLSLRAVGLIRTGRNTTIESAKALAIGFSKLLSRDVALEELFDLSIPKKRKAA